MRPCVEKREFTVSEAAVEIISSVVERSGKSNVIAPQGIDTLMGSLVKQMVRTISTSDDQILQRLRTLPFAYEIYEHWLSNPGNPYSQLRKIDEFFGREKLMASIGIEQRATPTYTADATVVSDIKSIARIVLEDKGALRLSWDRIEAGLGGPPEQEDAAKEMLFHLERLAKELTARNEGLERDRVMRALATIFNVEIENASPERSKTADIAVQAPIHQEVFAEVLGGRIQIENVLAAATPEQAQEAYVDNVRDLLLVREAIEAVYDKAGRDLQFMAAQAVSNSAYQAAARALAQ